MIDRAELLRLAEDLPSVWNSPISDPGLKQRIIRILIQEIVADVDDNAREIVLVVHWTGGRHSELRLPKPKTGHHGHCTTPEAVDVVRKMATHYTDEEIAFTLNRLRLRTGVGNTWNELRVRSLRWHLKLPARQSVQRNSSLNLQQAAKELGVSATVVRTLIQRKVLPATQLLPGAPWQMDAKDVTSAEVVRAAIALKNRETRQRKQTRDETTLRLPGL